MKAVHSGLAIAMAAVAHMPPVAAAETEGSIGVVEQSAAAEMHSNTRTIQMLLQMQGADRSLQSGDRLRRNDLPDPTGSARQRGARDAVAPLASQGTLGATVDRQKDVQPGPKVGWTDDSNRRAAAAINAPTQPIIAPQTQVAGNRGIAGADARSSARSEADSDEQQEETWFLARLMRLVRDNRGWVVAGCVLLLLVAAGGVVSNSRRR